MGEKVKGYRNIIGVTQEEMARRLSISVQSYRNKEKGRVSFRDTEKIKIKEMLEPIIQDIKIDDIFF